MKCSISVLLLIASLIICDTGFGQSPEPCGSPAVLTPWFKDYIKNPSQYWNRNRDTLIYFPLQIHSVGNDQGTGFFSDGRLLDALCALNSDYMFTGIQFYLAGEINYISKSSYNVHSSVLEGADMMFENNVDSVLNVYFVTEPAGTCGYNLPYAGIAMNKGCSGVGAHTFAHEVGHAFSVQHPHLGWDGNSYDPSQPTPTTLTYDYTYFQDTLIRDTLIIDTSIVELLDGSNCHEAGDFLCDTKADYLSTRWICDSDTLSQTIQTDPDGNSFRSDASLFMSYARDECSFRFTDEQVALMHANIATDKAHYKKRQSASDFIEQEVNLTYPLDENVNFESVVLEWEAVPYATGYVVEVAFLPNFPFTIAQANVQETSLEITDLVIDRQYYWRVKPYNEFSFCSDFVEGQFYSTVLTSATDIDLSTLEVYPTVVRSGEGIQIKPFDDLQSKNPRIRIFNSAGIAVYNDFVSNGYISTSGFPPGVYFMNIEIDSRHVVKKVIIF